MLGLKLQTDPRWVDLAKKNMGDILSDHAWCEQKAASNAISLITMNPEKEELVTTLLEIAAEEIDHFNQVHKIIKKRGLILARPKKDDYVNQLFKFCKKGGSEEEGLVDRLLFAAMVEARSCERFKLLSENIGDTELSTFYFDLMVSEAGHYTTFLKFAKKYGNSQYVERRWQEWLVFEGNLIKSFGKSENIHG
ncbi:MAG: tRNA-(ms[2]io[6]A)-hydroxylase [Crocinitomicaceae bacterium]